MSEEFYKHDIATYAGYLKDEKELLECTSGGIATAIARHMIKQGGYVAGVSYTDDFYNIHYEITNEEITLNKFKGSKYAEVDKENIYKDVKELLEDGKNVLFFGLPCMVAAMRLFLGKEYNNFLAVELICHGPTSIKVHYQYIKYLENKYNSKVIDFSVRRKDKSWLPAYLYAKFENGKIFQKEFYSTEYGYAFAVMPRISCHNCQFRGDNRTGDIMIGDFWGATESDNFYNAKGVSAILVHTEKGNNFLKSIKEIELFETSFERIVKGNQNIIKPRIMDPKRDKFSKLFSEHDLFYAVKHTKDIKTKIKSLIRKLIPSKLKPFARKIYHKIKP